jgi:hypothetical protein
MMMGRAQNAPMTSSTDTITIRRATSDDAAALDRLARLDSQRLVPGGYLVAHADGVLAAAISLETGRWFADPFRASEAIVDLLRERSAAVAGVRPHGRTRGVPALNLMRGLFPAAPRRAS